MWLRSLLNAAGVAIKLQSFPTSTGGFFRCDSAKPRAYLLGVVLREETFAQSSVLLLLLVFSRRSGGQLEFLQCISRISKGSELTALQRLGQAEVIAPVKVDVLVHQRGKTRDVLVLEHVALGAQLA